MRQALTTSYPSRFGTPVLTHVETTIFTARYFTQCMSCTFCNDSCCQYGVDIDIENVKRLETRKDEIEAFTGVPRAQWYTDEVETDVDHPGGIVWRVATSERGCVFLDRNGRGCMLHKLALNRGFDYHEVKPMISSLFPLTWDDGALTVAEEVEDRSLQCIDVGGSVYRGGRSELVYYFGEAMVAELDVIERGIGKG